jgi:Zn-dependent peptidase ImmA (M78 family)
MHFLITTLAASPLLRCGLNKRQLNETDFHNLVTIENIVYTETQERFSFWARIDGESHIVISDRWTGLKKLFIQFHELGHHFLHEGNDVDSVHFFDGGNHRQEYEAHAFATVALCPLQALLDNSFEVEDMFSDHVRLERERLYTLYHV